MTNYQKLYDGISKAAWGYFFIYFNININTVSLIPSFVGYFSYLQSIIYRMRNANCPYCTHWE